MILGEQREQSTGRRGWAQCWRLQSWEGARRRRGEEISLPGVALALWLEELLQGDVAVPHHSWRLPGAVPGAAGETQGCR